MTTWMTTTVWLALVGVTLRTAVFSAAGVQTLSQLPSPTLTGAASRCAPPPAGRSGPIGLGAGPSDAPIVDVAAADRGRRTYAAQCINCHGTQARGTDSGASLVRSV